MSLRQAFPVVVIARESGLHGVNTLGVVWSGLWRTAVLALCLKFGVSRQYTSAIRTISGSLDRNATVSCGRGSRLGLAAGSPQGAGLGSGLDTVLIFYGYVIGSH